MIEKDGVTDSEEEIIQHLRQLIRQQIGGFAVPEAFLVSKVDRGNGDFDTRAKMPTYF